MENTTETKTGNSSASSFTADDKLYLEIEKLKEAIKNFRRPFYLNPIVLLSISAAIVSIISSSANLQISNIKNEKNKLEAEKIMKTKDSLKKVNKQLFVENELLRIKKVTTKKELDSITSFVAILKESNNSKENKIYLDKIGSAAASVQSVYRVKDLGKFDLAKSFELQGFTDLRAGDFEKAQQSFEDSEKAVNGYHASYDIAKILRINKIALQSDEKVRAQILKTIIEKYGKYSTPEILAELKRKLN